VNLYIRLGYRSERNVEIFKNPAVFWRLARTYLTSGWQFDSVKGNGGGRAGKIILVTLMRNNKKIYFVVLFNISA
jgi:hypothetical protein